jgi:hypothetical protein
MILWDRPDTILELTFRRLYWKPRERELTIFQVNIRIVEVHARARDPA